VLPVTPHRLQPIPARSSPTRSRCGEGRPWPTSPTSTSARAHGGPGWTKARVAATEDWLAARAALEPASDLVGDLEALAAATSTPGTARHALLITALRSRRTGKADAGPRLRTACAARLLRTNSGNRPVAGVGRGAYTAMLARRARGQHSPTALTSFVGRGRRTHAALPRLIRESRLVTLVGPGRRRQGHGFATEGGPGRGPVSSPAGAWIVDGWPRCGSRTG